MAHFEEIEDEPDQLEKGYFVAEVDPALLPTFDPEHSSDLPENEGVTWDVENWEYVEVDGCIAASWDDARAFVDSHNQDVLDNLRSKYRGSLKGRITRWLIVFPSGYI